MKRILAALLFAVSFGVFAQEVLRTPADIARTVAYTGTAGSTSTWNPGPSSVMVFCTTACYVTVGEAVTATTSNGVPLPANTPIWLPVPRGTGATWRVSAIQVAAGGDVYAKPFN
jgi:hypothetical protein